MIWKHVAGDMTTSLGTTLTAPSASSSGWRLCRSTSGWPRPILGRQTSPPAPRAYAQKESRTSSIATDSERRKSTCATRATRRPHTHATHASCVCRAARNQA
eukprot:11357-Prymnesium_polylepis.2